MANNDFNDLRGGFDDDENYFGDFGDFGDSDIDHLDDIDDDPFAGVNDIPPADAFDDGASDGPSRTFIIAGVVLAFLFVALIAIIAAFLLLGNGDGCDDNCQLATEIAATNVAVETAIRASETAVAVQATAQEGTRVAVVATQTQEFVEAETATQQAVSSAVAATETQISIAATATQDAAFVEQTQVALSQTPLATATSDATTEDPAAEGLGDELQATIDAANQATQAAELEGAIQGQLIDPLTGRPAAGIQLCVFLDDGDGVFNPADDTIGDCAPIIRTPTPAAGAGTTGGTTTGSPSPTATDDAEVEGSGSLNMPVGRNALQQAASPSPTADAAAAAEAIQIDVPDVALPATYESVQEGLTVRVMHPEGWVGTDEGGSLLLANSQEALVSADQPELNLAAGQEIISVTLFPTMGTEMDFTGLIAGLQAEMSAQEGMTVGEPENVSVNGREGVRVALNGENGSGEVYLLSYNADYALLAIVAAGDYDAFRDTALAMVNAIEVEATETAPDTDTEAGAEATETGMQATATGAEATAEGEGFQLEEAQPETTPPGNATATTPSPAANATIVTVTPSPTPISSATVSVESGEGDQLVQQPITDANGNFILRDLPPGTYFITIGDQTVPIEVRESAVPYLLAVPLAGGEIIQFLVEGIDTGEPLPFTPTPDPATAEAQTATAQFCEENAEDPACSGTPIATETALPQTGLFTGDSDEVTGTDLLILLMAGMLLIGVVFGARYYRNLA